MQRLFTMFSRHSVRALRDLVTETRVKEGQLYASRLVVLAIMQGRFLLAGIVLSLEDCNNHGSVILSVAKAKNNVQWMFACNESGSSKTMKTSFMIIAGKEENESVLWISKVLLVFTFEGRVDCTGKNYVFLQYIEFTR